MTSKSIPDGYMQNTQGHLVPVDTIDPIELARDELVNEVIKTARQLQISMSHFKESAMGDVSAFVDLAAEKYGVSLGGKKGNVSLLSFDGRHKVQLAVADRLHFDERIQAAKALVDECIRDWTSNSRSEIKALIEHAFQTDKEGKINAGRVLGLMRLDIKDEKWRRAMEALKDSVQVISTTTYIRLYERIGDSDKFSQIPLDLAAL